MASDDELAGMSDLSLGGSRGGGGDDRCASSMSIGVSAGSTTPQATKRGGGGGGKKAQSALASPTSRGGGGGGGSPVPGSRSLKGGGRGGGKGGGEEGGGGGARGGGGGNRKESTSRASSHDERSMASSASGKRGSVAKHQADEMAGTSRLSHSKMVHLFSHLPQYSKRSSNLSKTVSMSKPELHPAVTTLGLLYADGSVRGSNARTAAMLLAFKEVIKTYQLAPDKVLRLDLDKVLKPHIQYLIDCRPHSIAMGNAIKWLRGQIHGIRPETSLSEAKEELVDAIDTYVTERITFAAEMLAKDASDKISDGDVILVYGRSYSVELTLKTAKKEGKNFRVVVVDSRPLSEGRRLLVSLSTDGIPTTYLNLNAISYVMRSVSKVFLGAAAMLSNGAVISRAGTALVAMMARRFNIPAIFCCETYKFSDKVQLDSICWNEVGDPSELVRGPPLDDWKDVSSLKLLNIRFDLTPMKYVSLVVTEVGLIPPTSVPVLIREYGKDDVNLNFDF